MILWHYTTKVNWYSIQRDQLLKPRHSHHTENLARYGVVIPEVLFTYDTQQHGFALHGQILDRASKLKCKTIIELQLQVEPGEIYVPTKMYETDRINLYHNGEIDELVYHVNEPITLVIKQLPIERATVVRVFDLDKFPSCEVTNAS